MERQRQWATEIPAGNRPLNIQGTMTGRFSSNHPPMTQLDRPVSLSSAAIARDIQREEYKELRQEVAKLFKHARNQYRKSGFCPSLVCHVRAELAGLQFEGKRVDIDYEDTTWILLQKVQEFMAASTDQTRNRGLPPLAINHILMSLVHNYHAPVILITDFQKYLLAGFKELLIKKLQDIGQQYMNALTAMKKCNHLPLDYHITSLHLMVVLNTAVSLTFSELHSVLDDLESQWFNWPIKEAVGRTVSTLSDDRLSLFLTEIVAGSNPIGHRSLAMAEWLVTNLQSVIAAVSLEVHEQTQDWLVVRFWFCQQIALRLINEARMPFVTNTEACDALFDATRHADANYLTSAYYSEDARGLYPLDSGEYGQQIGREQLMTFLATSSGPLALQAHVKSHITVEALQLMMAAAFVTDPLWDMAVPRWKIPRVERTDLPVVGEVWGRINAPLTWLYIESMTEDEDGNKVVVCTNFTDIPANPDKRRPESIVDEQGFIRIWPDQEQQKAAKATKQAPQRLLRLRHGLQRSVEDR